MSATYNAMAFPIQDLNQHKGPTGLTIREYAAIHLHVPDSGIPELDEMIRKSLRMEFAGKALQGISLRRWENADGTIPDDIFDKWSQGAMQVADVMLKEAGK